jgi:hypothetical protein
MKNNGLFEEVLTPLRPGLMLARRVWPGRQPTAAKMLYDVPASPALLAAVFCASNPNAVDTVYESTA